MTDAPRPVRIQLSRRKGFNLQEHSRAVNGLPAVNCARPGPFGNPFVIGSQSMPWLAVGCGFRGDRAGQRRAAVALHRGRLTGSIPLGNEIKPTNDLLEFEGGHKVSTSEHAQDLALTFAHIMGGFDMPPKPDISKLRGKNLACFCGLEDLCHVDTYLELANRPICEEARP
jgi:hypothetical protein